MNEITPPSSPLSPWTAEKILKNDRKSENFRSGSNFFLTTGLIVGLMAGGTLITRKFTRQLITPILIIVAIVSVALIALGLIVKAIQHYFCEVPSEQDRKKFAFPKLINAFGELRVFKTKEELEAVNKNKTLKLTNVVEVFDKTNQLYPEFVTIYYNPLEDLIPHFEIKSLNEEEKQTLLRIAYKRGFIVRFQEDFIQKDVTDSEKTLCIDQPQKELIQKSFEISVKFLVDVANSEKPLNVNLINSQLEALCVRIGTYTDIFSVLTPSIDLQEGNIIQLRVNPCKIGNPQQALKSLVKQFDVELIKDKSVTEPFSSTEEEAQSSELDALQILERGIDEDEQSKVGIVHREWSDLWQDLKGYGFNKLNVGDYLKALKLGQY